MGIITMQSSKTAWVGTLEWSYNGSSVTVTMYTGKTDGYPSSSSSGANFSATITVGGTSKSFSYQQQEIDMWVGSVTVPVSGSTVTISGRVDAPYGVSMYGYPLTGSETVTLSSPGPVVPDTPKVEPSEVTINTDTVQMGKKLLITIDADSQDAYHYLIFWMEDGTEIEIAENPDRNYTWTVPDLADLCPNGLEASGYIVCHTAYNGEYLGWTWAPVTLTVPDATVPSISGGEATMGQSCDVLCTRGSEYFSQKLELEFYGTTVQIAEGKIDSALWTPGYDLAALIPALTYGTGTLKCTTMNGTAVVGTETATIRLHVPENDETRPKFTAEDLTLVCLGAGGPFEGLYIRGKSGVGAEMNATSAYSSIEKYHLTVGSGSVEGNPAIFGPLVNDGTVKIVAKVTDARGYSTSVTTYIDVLPYKKPRVTPYTGYSSVICERALENGELSSKGTYLAIRAGMEFSSIPKDGQELNECRLLYCWKPQSAASWSGWSELLWSGSGQKQISVLIGNIGLSLDTSYDVMIQAEDSLGEYQILNFQIMTEAVSFVLYDGEDGAGFGKYPEAPHVVDIASHMTLVVRGGMLVKGEVWQDLGLAYGVNEAAFNIGKKPESGCHMLVSNGNHVHLAFDCSFEYTGTPILINRDRIPEAYRPKRDNSALCPADEFGIACVGVADNGEIWVNWVFDTKNGNGPMTVRILDGYIDYWI